MKHKKRTAKTGLPRISVPKRKKQVGMKEREGKNINLVKNKESAFKTTKQKTLPIFCNLQCVSIGMEIIHPVMSQESNKKRSITVIRVFRKCVLFPSELYLGLLQFHVFFITGSPYNFGCDPKFISQSEPGQS